MAGIRIVLDQEDENFIKEYKVAHGVSIQDFIREAVQKKISDIRIIEDLESLNRLKD